MGCREVVAEVVVTSPMGEGIAALERRWDGPGPRFVQITARYRNRCGGCGAEAPVGTEITYDRLERAPYHPSCAWIAIEPAPWLIPLLDGDAPMPGQVIAHPSYGWLICVRVAGRIWADSGVHAGSVIGVAARRGLPEEVELAQWRAHAGISGEHERSWLHAEQVGELVDAVGEFTGWPVTRAVREPEHFLVPHPSGLFVFCKVSSVEETERWMAADSTESSLYRRGYRWCRCYSVQCSAGEEGHVHLGAAIPMTRQQFDAANQRGWALT
jgi:hypothetical protein